MNNQNIDRLIQGIREILENRYSLLDEDVKLLNEVIGRLEELKQKPKSNGPATLLTVVKIVEILARVFFLTGGNS